MTLLQRVDGDLKTAMKSADKLKVSVLRLLKAAIKNKEIDSRRELSDEEVLSVLSSLAKQRRESIEQFSKGGREDLAETERLELAILQSYMPEQLSPEEIEDMILKAIEESGAQGEADLGKVMRLLMPRTKGLADGKWVNNRVRELLQSR
jgi:uncharacterized protein